MTPCCNELAPSVDSGTLSEYLQIYPTLFRGYGEIVLYDFAPGVNEQVRAARQAEDYPPDAPLLLDVYQVVREHKLLVYMHPGEGHQDSLERVFKQHTDITFIVHGEETEGNIGNLMKRYSNIYYTINELHGREYLLRPQENKSRLLATLRDYEPLIMSP